jgi:hypothetical protein
MNGLNFLIPQVSISSCVLHTLDEIGGSITKVHKLHLFGFQAIIFLVIFVDSDINLCALILLFFLFFRGLSNNHIGGSIPSNLPVTMQNLYASCYMR